MNMLLNRCMLCPRQCGVNRNNGEIGFCMASNKIRIAKAYLHKWEEPCISGDRGSGTIFFSNCNLRCIFCQNYYISEEGHGRLVDVDEFSDICLSLEKMGAMNINLVTPTHYVSLIVEGVKLAKEKGLSIPIIYNSSGYEMVDTIKMLNGIVDVYLPDFKYYSDEYALKYSSCKDYFKYAKESLAEMVRQQPKCEFNVDGFITKGVIVRHLLLPGMENDSKFILKYLYDNYKDNIYISIMNQYTPVRKCKFDELNRTVDNKIYDSIIDYAWNLGIRNAFVQEGESQSDSFIPDFSQFN